MSIFVDRDARCQGDDVAARSRSRTDLAQDAPFASS
jgi:hypothetical protein